MQQQPQQHASNPNVTDVTTDDCLGPTLLRPQETPTDVICSICMSISIHPVVTPQCEHLFCYDCIRQSMKEHPYCPIDRKPCKLESLKRIQDCSPFIHRIWCSVQVKCAFSIRGCCWIGSIADYMKHYQSDCHFNTTNKNKNNNLHRKMLRKYYAGNMIEDDDDEDHEKNLEVEIKMFCLEEKVRELEKKNESLATSLVEYKKNERLKEENDQDTLRPTIGAFDIHYNYSSRNIVKLNQLIATYLEDKPNIVDRNRIFSCVRSNFIFYIRKSKKKFHPEGFQLDTHMLLATCLACNWFTPNQFRLIRQWLIIVKDEMTLDDDESE
jgi:Zinc finger, C3HC4 type (RING finger)